jgi:oligopeptide/dipeptide ABC transporter ATP-binding protein
MSMVLITHDVGAVAGLADRVAVMQAGRIVEQGPVARVLKHPEHAYTQSLLLAVPRIGDFLDSSQEEDVVSTTQPAALLSFRNLGVQFRLRNPLFKKAPVVRAVDDVSLDIHPGEVVGLVGESGSGKSTLARAALGLVRTTEGAVDSPHNRRDLQLVFQDPVASLDPRMTVEQIVTEPLRVHEPQMTAEARAKTVEHMLLRVGLGKHLMTRYPHELSGGQAQRVGIARAMILKPKLLVCDEAVSALDVSVQAQILALLRDLKRDSDTAILFISHNLAVVQQLCDRVVVLYLGRMMEEGPTQHLYSAPAHPYTRGLLAAVPVPDPDVQPARLQTTLGGELPSPVAPPSGCVFRTRCPHAAQVCSEQIPRWEAVRPTHYVACHRWREIGNVDVEA